MPNPLILGAWLRLEQALNELAAKEELFVISGPLYLDSQPPGINSPAQGFEPVAYFKIAVGQSGFLSFVFPANLRQHESYCDQLGELQSVEQMSGLRLLDDRKLGQSLQLLTDLGCGIDR